MTEYEEKFSSQGNPICKLIPAGTGMKRYHDVKLDADAEFEAMQAEVTTTAEEEVEEIVEDLEIEEINEAEEMDEALELAEELITE